MSWNRTVSVEYLNGVGAGCVIAPGLILTAHHLTGPAAGREAAHREVRLLSGGPGPRVPAEVAWHRGDAVLLRCRPEDLGEVFAPVRWGELTCTKPSPVPECSAVGLPRAALRSGLDAAGEAWQYRAPATVTGRINVVDNASHPYSLQIDGQPPEGEAGSSPWRGISGAGVFCEDLLLGLVTTAPRGWNHGRLEALPVRQLLDDPGLCDIIEQATGMRPRLEPADIDGLFDNPPQPASAASYLLSPRSETVEFTGLDTELSTLWEWSTSARTMDIAVVHGPGGIGKTRMATELARRLSERRPEAERHDGRDVPWTAGFLSEEPVLQPPPYAMLRHLVRPVLVVVDYAESRLPQVEQLLAALATHQAPGRRIRVLLLARSIDVWWRQLRIRHAALTTGLALALAPQALYRNTDRRQVRDHAARDFSRRLATLHRAGVPDDWSADDVREQLHIAAVPSTPDTAIGESSTALAVRDTDDVPDQLRADAPPPPDTAAEADAVVLAVHMDALARVLLDTPDRFTDDIAAQTVLIEHEMKHVQRAARKEQLDLDFDLLRALITVQGMGRARTKGEATSVFETAWDFYYRGFAAPPVLAPDTILKLRRMARALYPAPDRTYLGGIGPDALLAALIAQHEAPNADEGEEDDEDEDHGFLDRVLSSPRLGEHQRRQCMVMLVRALPTQPQLLRGAARVVAAHTDTLRGPADAAAGQLPPGERTDWLGAIERASVALDTRHRKAEPVPTPESPPGQNLPPRARARSLTQWADDLTDLQAAAVVAVAVLIVAAIIVPLLLTG
ncbi:trypsin-like peptidase domain-containing protein [Streptomyces melanogenes]|uniref:trypsin-like peptidase domain-containing protein n=1 Tax=Streptomyces melanogenes TaxID=67326 RepID=UPI00167D78AE|nr:trypsin-like peptidase domain-containing protein [Streptomyces melanogenes]GGP75797.1 hypothetical protein GCM10010278_62590 [Streptomyces melanogenes]